MKTEKEIREFLKSIKEAEKLPAVDNMVVMTERAGHWQDALEWVLEK